MNDLKRALSVWSKATKDTRRRDHLGHGEKLIRLLSSSLKGQLAIVVTSDDDVEYVYTVKDWKYTASPSLQFDADGDLVWTGANGEPTTKTVQWKLIGLASVRGAQTAEVQS